MWALIVLPCVTILCVIIVLRMLKSRHEDRAERKTIISDTVNRDPILQEELALLEKIHDAAKTHNFPEVIRLTQEHLSRYDLTNTDFAIKAHFFLINAVQTMYFYRDEDPLAYNHCLMLCDMDIANYDNLPSDFVCCNPVLPERKAIILEKMDWLEDAAELCQQAIRDNWGYASMPWEKRLLRLQKRIASSR